GQLPADSRQILEKYTLGLSLGVELQPKSEVTMSKSESLAHIGVERGVINISPNIAVPFLLLVPPRAKEQARPPVVAFSEDGKGELLKRQAAEIARLLEAGVVVCLPDLRGTGETRPGDGRGRTSSSTSISATEWMLGRTLLGGRLQDLIAVLAYLRSRLE